MQYNPIMRKAYKYRIYPSHAQVTQLKHTLGICCELYNAALSERRDAYRLERKLIRYVDQQNQLPGIKASREDVAGVHSQVLQDVLRRLDKAFDAFFRRLKTGERPGYPRFRSGPRYDSFTYSQSGFSLKDDKLRLSKIGNVRIKLHRPIGGEIKTLTVRHSATGKWYACFSVEVEALPLPEQMEGVGIDCGLEKFATLSTGKQIANPHFFRTDEKALGRAQRQKKRKVAARLHERISNRRRDFSHQLSRALVSMFGVIVFEKLNIKSMVKNHCLAKSIQDAAWNQLVQYTSYKAEEAGRRVVLVDPRNTSKRCSSCGQLVEKSLSQRIHDCPCGLRLDRDHNAAINILSLGLQTAGIPLQEAASWKDAE
jgi:putative transposase